MPDPTSTAFLTAFVAVFLGSTLSGLTGFGFALIAVPLLTLVIPPQVAVPMVRLHSLLIGGIVVLEAWRWLNLRLTWVLIVASLVGLPLGAYLLVVWDANALKVFIGVVTVLFASLLLVGVRVQVGEGSAVKLPVGFLSGLLGGSTGMAGPPIVIFFAGQGVDKQTFRVNLAMFFVLQNLASVPVYLAGGILTTSVITYTALLLPALIIGTPLGIRLSHRFHDDVFRRLALVMIIAAGLLAIVTGLHLV